MVKHFVLIGKSHIFAPLEPAKPLNDAQIGGSFFIIPNMKASFAKPYCDLQLKEGTTFEQVLTLYRFDKKLRILLFNEIEKIEVTIRSVLTNLQYVLPSRKGMEQGFYAESGRAT